MTNWIDIKELRKQLDFEEVLRHYGVEVKLTGEQHHGFCPLPSHKGKKNSPSFSASIKRRIWQCFGCGGKGNVLDFAVLMEEGNPKNGSDVRRVAKKLMDRFFFGFGIPADQPENEKAKISPLSEEEDVVTNAPLDFELKGLDAKHQYLSGRGFTAETIERFGLGYCARGLLANRVAIPIHDAEGILVGYAGRVVNDDEISESNPKYKFPGRRKRKEVIHEFRKSLLLYNANRIPAPVDDLIIVEGFASVWWLTQAGIGNLVALMGASCSFQQAETIVSLVYPSGRVWIFTDGDPAGERAAREIFNRVAPRLFVRWVKVDERKQPTAFVPEMLKKLLPLSKRGDF